MSTELSAKNCVPCRGGIPQLSEQVIQKLLEELDGWIINSSGHLEKSYTFRNFREGFDFVKRVGEMAEEQGHHPDIYLAWGKVVLEIWTHKIDGLVENDFIFAAKADALIT
jgi:4a-hydroxytetrahydrobiopterin dehydratase